MNAETKCGIDEAAHAAEEQAAPRQRAGKTVASARRPALERTLPRSTAEPKKPRGSSPAGNSPSAPSKSFSMSYDGMTQADYIQHLLDRRWS